MALFGKKKQSIDLLSKEDTTQKSAGLVPFIIVGVIIVLLQVGGAGVLFLLNYSVNKQIDSTKKQEESQLLTWQGLAPTANNVKTILAKNSLYLADLKKFSGLDTKLDKIRSLIPDGVTISQITLDNTGKTTMSALSSRADEGYELATVVQKNSSLTNVSLDGITKQANGYQFIISFLIKD